jgi:hypothetical protein
LTSNSYLLREAEKPDIWTGYTFLKGAEMFTWEAVQNLVESLSRVQGDVHPTSAVYLELGTVLITVKVRL